MFQFSVINYIKNAFEEIKMQFKYNKIHFIPINWNIFIFKAYFFY